MTRFALLIGAILASSHAARAVSRPALADLIAESAINEPLILPAPSESTLRVILGRRTLVYGSPPSGGQQIAGGYFEIGNPLVNESRDPDSVLIALDLEQCTYGMPDRTLEAILGFHFLGAFGQLFISPEAIAGFVQWRARVTVRENAQAFVVVGKGVCGGRLRELDRRTAVQTANRRALWDLAVQIADRLNDQYAPKTKRRPIDLDQGEVESIIDGHDE